MYTEDRDFIKDERREREGGAVALSKMKLNTKSYCGEILVS